MEGGDEEATKMVETGRADRSVWLMKCPVVVARSWQSRAAAEPHNPNTLAKVVLSLDPLLTPDNPNSLQFTMEMIGSDPGNVPNSYSLNMSKDIVPMCVFSETPQGRLAVEGKVEHKFDMKPNSNSIEEYGRLCRERTNKAMIKNRQVQVIDNDRGVHMRPLPGMIGVISSTSKDKKKLPLVKPSDVKRTRRDKGELEDIIAFSLLTPCVELMPSGNRGVGRTPLDWTTRLKLAAGAANGITFIHESCKSLRLVHGNIKSTNILIDRSGDACVTDYGLTAFLSSSAPLRPNGYRAPEAATDSRKLSQKSDVYSFGVVLLELLTGKCPSSTDNEDVREYGGGTGGVLDLPRWVQSVVREEWTAEVFDLELMRYKDIEEGMVGLLQVAMACTCAAPEQRPNMGQVVRMIDELRGFEVSSGHRSLNSPSLSEGTSQ